MRPTFPSLIKSDSSTPWFWYFFATDTTNRRFERTILSRASRSPPYPSGQVGLFIPIDERILAYLFEVLVEGALSLSLWEAERLMGCLRGPRSST